MRIWVRFTKIQKRWTLRRSGPHFINPKWGYGRSYVLLDFWKKCLFLFSIKTLNPNDMAFFKEFKEFALKGNVMDMAVGVIIGGAFGKIVSSLVNDILMPPIGALIGNTDFSQLKLDISKVRDVTSSAMQSVEGIVAGSSQAPAAAAEPIYWNYGAFIQQCVDFTILALCVFLMVKLMNRLMQKKEEAPAPAPEPPAPTKEELLLTEIRDLLKEQKK